MPRVHDLTDEMLAFWAERHLCTVTTLRADGRPHVVPLGVALDPVAHVAWAITSPSSQKVANLRRDPRIAACQVDRARWATLEGRAEVRTDAASVAEAVERYAGRYRQPRDNPDRVALRIELDRVIGNV
ncbi:pyridoxamine 5'-phosphate oxidase family protein [Nocardioides marmoribigeumensis]|uniref:PPOX class probable F420-dependent enzyme n=1 Tax=Nocardioides marmoribigeumensis TaxID=433649 RepID=A0ABU2BPF3_9ACTN|nr:PPOX class F420-dependent oxidoreductase [Nocardioides marmoribigeumensis]MDR7360496.1 PPOX class probable F420-dependent enzyme [Nocardioides marmoribigeumensis]